MSFVSLYIIYLPTCLVTLLLSTPFFLELYMWKFFETYVGIKSSVVLVFVRYFEYPFLETSLCNIPPLKFSEHKPNILTTKPSMWERACGFTFLGRVFFFFSPSSTKVETSKSLSCFSLVSSYNKDIAAWDPYFMRECPVTFCIRWIWAFIS